MFNTFVSPLAGHASYISENESFPTTAVQQKQHLIAVRFR